MSSPIPFDEPCPCGSGALYRDCCGRAIVVKRRQRRNLVIGIFLAAAVAVPTLAYMYKLDQQKREELTLPPGSYYSPEHKHWHDAEGQEIVIPGYVWSTTQQRWIKINDALIEQIKAEEARTGNKHSEPVQQPFENLPESQGGVPEPQGAVPEGEVWSETHGHYHDDENV